MLLSGAHFANYRILDFHFGIQWPVIGAGLLCDRVDRLVHFRGSIVEHIKERIQSAQLVIADLAKANADVFFEAGYADALGKAPLLIMHQKEIAYGRQFQFDIYPERPLYLLCRCPRSARAAGPLADTGVDSPGCLSARLSALGIGREVARRALLSKVLA